MIDKLTLVISFPLLLAWRTLTTSQTAPIRLMLALSWASVFIVVGAFSLIIGVMQGFEQETYKKLQGVHDDITIRAYGQELNTNAIKTIITTEFASSIYSINQRATQYSLILSDTEQPHVVLVTGIELNELTKNKLIQTLNVSATALEKLTCPGSFLISTLLARLLALSVNDLFTLALPAEHSMSESKIYFDRAHAHGAGFFQSGMEDFDMSVILCSLETFHSIFETDINEIGLVLLPHASPATSATELRLRFGPSLDIATWQELYPTLIEALNLEKCAMVIILILVSMISCLSIFSLLFMLMHQKRVEISLMRAHGIGGGTIARAYILLGCTVAGSAAWCGILVSIGIAQAIRHYQLIPIPQAFGLACLPIVMNWYSMIGIVISAVLMSFITCFIATRRMDALSVANVLRFET